MNKSVIYNVKPLKVTDVITKVKYSIRLNRQIRKNYGDKIKSLSDLCNYLIWTGQTKRKMAKNKIKLRRIQDIVLFEINLRRSSECDVETLCRVTGLRPKQIYTALRHLKNRGFIKKRYVHEFGIRFPEYSEDGSPIGKKLLVSIKEGALNYVPIYLEKRGVI